MAKHIRVDERGKFVVTPKEGETYSHDEEELLQLYLKGRGYDKGRDEFKAEREEFEKTRTELEAEWSRKGNLLDLYAALREAKRWLRG